MEEKGEVKVGQREVRRSEILKEVLAGDKSLVEACDSLGVKYRQAKRIMARYKKGGQVALVHGNKGRKAYNRVSEETRKRVVSLSQEKYRDFNDRHFCECLNEREEITLGREKVRQIRRDAGIVAKHSRVASKHRKRRERKEHRGEMMIWDGSHHHWFGKGKERVCLLAAVEDATSMILASRFEPSETSVGYLRLLKQVLAKHGAPSSVYQDQHRALFRADEHWSLEEQQQGRQNPTQVGMVLEDLDIRAIRALSPQAKGRVERLFGTLQDRLVTELAHEGITDIDKANEWLSGFYIRNFNKHFGEQPEKSQSLFRRQPMNQLQDILAFRYQRTVANDNTISVNKLVIQIPPGPSRRGYAKAKVDVRQRLDGSWTVHYMATRIASHPPTTLRSPQMARTTRSAKGTTQYVWSYMEAADD